MAFAKPQDAVFKHSLARVLSLGSCCSLEEAASYGTGVFEFPLPGALLFERVDSHDCLLHSTISEQTGVAPFDELRTAWATFSDHVRILVTQTFPGIEKNKFWAAWFQGEPDKVSEVQPKGDWFSEHSECLRRSRPS